MNTPKVFVSHASEDKDRFVLGFAEKLRARGIDAWLDKWEMAPGDSLVDKIFEEGIKHAQAVIVVLSQKSVQKRWVREELNAGMVKRINESSKLIPVVIEACEMPECLKSTLWVRVQDLSSYEAELDNIVAAIYDHREKPPVGPPPAYVQTAMKSVPGLSSRESLVLRLVYEKALEQENTLINLTDVEEPLNKLDIRSTQLPDALEALDYYGYIQAVRGINRAIAFMHITAAGFEQYACMYLPGYDDLITSVALQIVNEGKTTSSSIVEALNQPSMLVKHILDRLAQERLIQAVTGADWERIILDVSPELRRRLEA